MKLTRLAPPAAALAAAALFTLSQTGEAFNLLGWSLGPGQRDFRVFNNFTDTAANNNQTPDPSFPGAQGAVQAIWKASVEWGSTLHGDGTGDPHQATGLGSGQGNFDPSFQGEANGIGNLGENVHSELNGSQGGVLAFAENNGSGLWRIRYYSTWTWNDGPNTNIPGGHFDLQSVACHEYGHALGLAHSQFNSATMAPSAAPGQVAQRSISNDDSNGVQAIYGSIDPNVKPLITSVAISGSNVTINGENFAATGNTVWFTREDGPGNGQVLTVDNVSSSNGGTLITVTAPNNAQSGDVLVRNTETQGKGISNAWPVDLDGGTTCPAPTTYCFGSPNSVSISGATLTVTGSQDTTINDTTLTATFLPPNQFGIFIYGMAQQSLPVGDGVLCVGGSLIRLPAQSTGTGTMSSTLDFNNLPIGGDISAGETWNFQTWFRDAAGGPAGNNLSSAVEVQFCN